MKAGVFMMPSHPPERGLYEGHAWDLQHLEFVDRVGFHEAWIGEHFTAPWEPNPAPDLPHCPGTPAHPANKTLPRCPSPAVSPSG